MWSTQATRRFATLTLSASLICERYAESQLRTTPRVDSWHIRVDGMNLTVTEAAFERIQQAMLESK